MFYILGASPYSHRLSASRHAAKMSRYIDTIDNALTRNIRSVFAVNEADLVRPAGSRRSDVNTSSTSIDSRGGKTTGQILESPTQGRYDEFNYWLYSPLGKNALSVSRETEPEIPAQSHGTTRSAATHAAIAENEVVSLSAQEEKRSTCFVIWSILRYADFTPVS